LLPPGFSLQGAGGAQQRTFSRGSNSSRRSGKGIDVKKVELGGEKIAIEALDPHIKSMVVYSELDDDQETVHTSTIKVRRRIRGQPVLVEREVFFRGMVYIIEEEVYSDSDRSSVYTSEDEMTVEK
jgi:hypothetical protein